MVSGTPTGGAASRPERVSLTDQAVSEVLEHRAELRRALVELEARAQWALEWMRIPVCEHCAWCECGPHELDEEKLALALRDAGEVLDRQGIARGVR